MTTYIIRRVLHAVLVIFIVSVIVFLLLRSLPGDPIMLVMSMSPNEFSEEQMEALRHDLGMDRPLYVQYFDWMFKMLRGDFGTSIINKYDIAREMRSRVTVTMMIGLSAFVIGWIIGPLLGIVSAIRRGKLIDNIVAVVANIGITAPQFWIAILLIFLFSMRLGWLPLYGYTLPWVDFGLSMRQSVLPVFVTALMPIASAARQSRSSVLEVLNQDYVRTAWAKGLNERKVIVKHVLKNALMPVVTLQGQMLRMIVGGSVVVERVMVIPGMGKFMVDALLARDYSIVQAVTVVMTAVIVISSLVVDLLYGWIDPRIQYD